MTPSAPTALPDYEQLRDTLVNAGAVVALTELHGGLCGALCAGGVPAAQRWLADSLDDMDLDAAAVAEELAELVSASARMLVDGDLQFEPLLPGDDAPLDEQVQALALWCHGFLGGVGVAAAGTARTAAEGATLKEILGDFAEISRAGLSEDEAAGQGQPDFALAQIHEYVRVSVLIVYEELRAERTAAVHDLH